MKSIAVPFLPLKLSTTRPRTLYGLARDQYECIASPELTVSAVRDE